MGRRNLANMKTENIVALCDVDDPFAVPEILDRDQAWALLGRDFIESQECVE